MSALQSTLDRSLDLSAVTRDQLRSPEGRKLIVAAGSEHCDVATLQPEAQQARVVAELLLSRAADLQPGKDFHDQQEFIGLVEAYTEQARKLLAAQQGETAKAERLLVRELRRHSQLSRKATSSAPLRSAGQPNRQPTGHGPRRGNNDHSSGSRRRSGSSPPSSGDDDPGEPPDIDEAPRLGSLPAARPPRVPDVPGCPPRPVGRWAWADKITTPGDGAYVERTRPAKTWGRLDGVQWGKAVADSPASDWELIERYREQKEEVAFCALLIRHGARTLSWYYVERRPGLDMEEVGAAAQEGFLQAVETFNPHRGASFPTWAKRCVRSRKLDVLRALHRREEETLAEQIRRETPPGFPV